MLDQVDWTRRWYDSVRPAFERFDFDALGLTGALNAGSEALALVNTQGQPIRFVPQSHLPEGRAYEEFIGATGCVPTRENLHDFFNGLVWLTFPLIKQQLNALQAAQIALAGVGKSRGPARDGATIFDENSALLIVREGGEGEALVAALRAHRWSEALHQRRALFGAGAQVWLFGHALMEKLVAPRKAITAHVYRAPVAINSIANMDAWLAADLGAEKLSSKPFCPLPVLGVPGWWLENENFSFYDDSFVFRPRR